MDLDTLRFAQKSLISRFTPRISDTQINAIVEYLDLEQVQMRPLTRNAQLIFAFSLQQSIFAFKKKKKNAK